jgi:hypothetical protein
MRSYLQLQDEVLAHHFSASRYRARVQGWLNEAIRRLVKTARIPSSIATETVAVSSGDADYDLTSDYNFIEYVTITGNSLARNPLYSMEEREYDESGDIPTGTPTRYILSGLEGITLYPTPNQTFTLEVTTRNPASGFSIDTQTVADLGLPELEDYESAAVAFALWKAYESEHDVEMATYWQGQWTAEQARARIDLQHRDPNAVAQVRGMIDTPAGPSFRRP